MHVLDVLQAMYKELLHERESIEIAIEDTVEHLDKLHDTLKWTDEKLEAIEQTQKQLKLKLVK